MAENKEGVEPANTKSKISPQKVNYESIDSESFAQIINKKIPKVLTPTKRINKIFGAIFILTLIISAMQFPLGSMMSGEFESIAIKVGFPLHFLELDSLNKDKSPTLPINLLIDLLLYLIVAYAIDISLGLIMKNPLVESEEEIKQRPVVFKDKDKTIAEKVTEKVIEKIEK
ncbi:MAG: hypothetical protein OEL87_02850 [Nanoarchaeota archaeon]|nr:hypothetical protein [Nanoarchaeota archaeon]